MQNIIKQKNKKDLLVFFYIFIKKIVADRRVANIDSKIYGINKNFFFVSRSEVSSYKNSVDIKVPKHEMNPKN